MNSRNFSLCVIGCGKYAADFAESIRETSREIDLFFASRDGGRAREYAQRFGGKGYFDGYAGAAESDQVDALYICTPHHLHLEHAELGIRNGKHVLVEKPIAHNREDGIAMVSSARDSGVTLMVAENVRFMAQVRRCRELVSEGAVGKLRLIQFQEEYPFGPGAWRGVKAMNGGGVLVDGGIHKVHFMRYLAGEPESVFAAELPAAMRDQEGEDGMLVTLVWPGGAVGLINHSWTAGSPRPPTVEVSGTGGRIHFEVGSGTLKLEQGSVRRDWRFPDDHRGLPAMVREFRSSILEKKPPEVTGEEGLRDLALVHSAYRSARQGTPVFPSHWLPTT